MKDGYDRKESKSNDADSFVGGLYNLSGDLLYTIPPMKGAEVLNIDGHPIRMTVIESGELLLESLTSTDNKILSIKNARNAHCNDLEELCGDSKRIGTEKLEAEEEYCNALGGAFGGAQGKEPRLSLLNLVAQEKSTARKIAELENTKELEVKFTSHGGMTASLQPGIITAVPFVTTPIVWCPKSLAKVTPLDDTVNVVTVPIVGPRLETPSQILCEDMFNELSSMIPGNTTMVLHKLHDQTKSITAASYDKHVRPQSNVLTVIQSSTGQVFGGFFVDPMGAGSEWHNGHEDDFIFSLGNNDQHSRVPVKLLKPKGYTDARALYRGSGLHMNDLTAFNSHHTKVPFVYTVPAKGYPSLPQGESIGGKPGNFKPTKMEVYQIRTASQK